MKKISKKEQLKLKKIFDDCFKDDKNIDRDTTKELFELIEGVGLKVTFDPYRNNTKGCGIHCKAWYNSKSETYCKNHQDAIDCGKYIPK